MKTDQEPTILGIESLRAGLNATTPAQPITADVIEEALAAIDATRQGLNALEAALRKLPTMLIASPPRAKHPRPQLVKTAPEPKPAPTRSAAPAPGRGPQAILDALAWWEMVGVMQPLRQQVAFVAGYTVNGHFNNLTGQLRTHGHLAYPAGNRLCLTTTGKHYADYPTAPPTRAALHERIRAKLSSTQARLFDVLLTYEGEVITNEDLAYRAGYTVNGHFSSLRGSLRALQIIEYERGGSRLADWLYPAELPE